MKIVCGLSAVMIAISVIAQVDEIKLEREFNEMDYSPQIAGYFHGDIPEDKVCDVRGLFTGRGLRIVVFDLEYYDGREEVKIHVVGNQIPDSVCMIIKTLSIENELFFTGIKAVDLDGSIKNLPPMRLVAVKEDE
ncbi:MAG: hypothetical protein R3277_10510 [Brumimicrobium sp.]|nr:hypothetical protein [Brumimicrobium sp.]